MTMSETMSEMSAESHWLFLRGLAREARHWGSFIEKFEAALPGARVHALDLPGAGKNFKQTCPSTISAMSELVREEFLSQVPTGARKNLLAISLGGMVGIDWLSRYPEDFSSVVLINSSFAGLSFPFERLRPQAALQVAKIASLKDPLDKERAVLSLVSNRPELRERVAGEWADYARSFPLSPGNAARQLVAASRFRFPEVVPNVPTLVLSSRADRMVNSICSEHLVKRLKCSLSTHSTAGHDLPLDDGDWVAAEVSRWYKNL